MLFGRNVKPSFSRSKTSKKQEKPRNPPLVRLVPHGTPGSHSIEVRTPFWVKRLCVFRDQDAEAVIPKYREWFFAGVDANSPVLMEALEGLLEALKENGQVLLACDNYNRDGHGHVIKEYLVWEHRRRGSPGKPPAVTEEQVSPLPFA